MILQPRELWHSAILCEVVEICRSGFYAYVQQQAVPQLDRQEVALRVRVQALHGGTRQSYGSRRMVKQLQAEGCAVGRAKARRLMQEMDLAVRRRTRHGPVTTDSPHRYPVAPNLLARQFEVEQPHQVWAGHSTYIWTAEGWLYLAVLLDWYARKVVGWALSAHSDSALAQEARWMALGGPGAHDRAHTSFRSGGQDACHAHQCLLTTYDIR